MPWDTHHAPPVVKRQGTRGEKLSGLSAFNPVPWDGFALLWEFPHISPAQLDDGKPLLIPDVNKVERSVHDKKERREENFSINFFVPFVRGSRCVAFHPFRLTNLSASFHVLLFPVIHDSLLSNGRLFANSRRLLRLVRIASK